MAELHFPRMDNPEYIEQAAKVCHEAIRAYCETLGDNALLPWEQAPEWQRESSRAGVRFYFGQCAAGIEPSAPAIHEQWVEQKRAEGWKRGAARNSDTKEHPMLVEFDALSPEEQRKDHLFAAVCKAFCEAPHPVAHK